MQSINNLNVHEVLKVQMNEIFISNSILSRYTIHTTVKNGNYEFLSYYIILM